MVKRCGGGRVTMMAALLLLTPLLGACGMTRAAQRPPAPMTVVQPKPPEMLAPKKGSIWQTTNRNSLFLDNKARNVGDIVVVQISETSSANKSATTDLSRDNTDEVDLGGMFGWSAALAARGNQFLDDAASITGKHEYAGSGSTTRRGTFTATISCQVIEVLGNGNLRIEGRRDITVNNENQYIIMSGIIRPEDIGHNNAVRSSQVADARIEYSGDGNIDDQQRPGWLNQLFAAFRIL